MAENAGYDVREQSLWEWIMGLFDKVKGAAATKAPAKSKKETVWLVGDPAGDVSKDETVKVAKSIKELTVLAVQAKAVEAKMGVHKGVIKEFAESKFVESYVRLGVHPETPMQVQNADGEKITFVVQDRGSQYAIKDDQREALNGLLGEDATTDLLYEETTFGLNRDILALPGVQAIVEKALESAVRKLTDDKDGKPVLPPELAEQLLDVKVKTAFKPGTLDRLTLICGRDTTKVAQFIEIAGSSITRYVKT